MLTNKDQTVYMFLGRGRVKAIERRTDEVAYWRKMKGFVRRNLSKKLGQLSTGELEWLVRIKKEVS